MTPMRGGWPGGAIRAGLGGTTRTDSERVVFAQMSNCTLQDDQDAGRDHGEAPHDDVPISRFLTLPSSRSPRFTQFLPVLCMSMSLAFGIKDGVAVSSTDRAFSYCNVSRRPYRMPWVVVFSIP